MPSSTLEKSLMLVAALLAITAAARWRASNPSMTSVPPRVAELRSNAPAVTDSALEEAETLAVTNDPFRLSNMPPEARFDPANEVAGSARAFTPPPVRPTFVLKAIVGGPPWQAVVDGIPGQPAGTVTRQGAQFDKLVVRSVTRDSVIIQGPDTAWVLRFGRQP